jgi:hypothetical protein
MFSCQPVFNRPPLRPFSASFVRVDHYFPCRCSFPASAFSWIAASSSYITYQTPKEFRVCDFAFAACDGYYLCRKFLRVSYVRPCLLLFVASPPTSALHTHTTHLSNRLQAAPETTPPSDLRLSGVVVFV